MVRFYCIWACSPLLRQIYGKEISDCVVKEKWIIIHLPPSVSWHSTSPDLFGQMKGVFPTANGCSKQYFQILNAPYIHSDREDVRWDSLLRQSTSHTLLLHICDGEDIRVPLHGIFLGFMLSVNGGMYPHIHKPSLLVWFSCRGWEHILCIRIYFHSFIHVIAAHFC